MMNSNFLNLFLTVVLASSINALPGNYATGDVAGATAQAVTSANSYATTSINIIPAVTTSAYVAAAVQTTTTPCITEIIKIPEASNVAAASESIVPTSVAADTVSQPTSVVDNCTNANGSNSSYPAANSTSTNTTMVSGNTTNTGSLVNSGSLGNRINLISGVVTAGTLVASVFLLSF